MINSGDFKLISDFEFRTNIEEHYSLYEAILKDYARQETIHKDYLGNYLINHADYDAMRQGAFGFGNEAMFKNNLQSMSRSLIIKRDAILLGIESCEKLLQVLN